MSVLFPALHFIISGASTHTQHRCLVVCVCVCASIRQIFPLMSCRCWWSCDILIYTFDWPQWSDLLQCSLMCDVFCVFFSSGSACLFTALLTKCSERNVFALCRCISRRNYPPRFVALVPQKEEVDEGKVQVTPPGNKVWISWRCPDWWTAAHPAMTTCPGSGFHVIFLPYADDIRALDPPQCPVASQTQVDKMKQIVTKLRFKYR